MIAGQRCVLAGVARKKKRPRKRSRQASLEFRE
jgi:hypothetical protein